MHSISVAMIVKNEASRLAACLEALRAVADEIVIVDTGSTDGTPAMARTYTDHVHIFPWADDFASARNQALRKASGDWILVVDADELLAQPEAASVALRRFALSQPEHCVGTLAIHNHFGEGDAQGVHLDHVERFFRRDAFTYAGAIHEQLRATAGRKTSAPTGVHLLHTGYAQSIQDPAHKALRNIPLLEKEIARHPDDEYYRFQLGKAFFSLGRFGAAALSLEAALACIDFARLTPTGRLGPVARPVLTDLLATLAHALVSIGAPERAADLLDRHCALAHLGTRRADFHHARGYAHLMGGALPASREGFETALALGSGAEDVLGTGSFSATYHLGLLCEAEDRMLDAVNAYLQSLASKGDYVPTLRRFVDLVVEQHLVIPAEVYAVCNQDALQRIYTQRAAEHAQRGNAEAVMALLQVAATLSPTLEAACRQACALPPIAE